MKGPGLRADLDVRRLWKCPRCGREMRYSGDVVSHVCHCQKEGAFMQLVEESKPVPEAACREVRGSGDIPESFAPPAEPGSEPEFGAGISEQRAPVNDSSSGQSPDSASSGSSPA